MNAKIWRAKPKETYYFLDNNFDICTGVEDEGNLQSYMHYTTLNYFRTYDFAKFVSGKIKALLEGLHND